MIKTMLLTAQLALSPLVGTNGLQPKRLPNPVYGESLDYSVTFQGQTFERFHYSEDDYIYNPDKKNLPSIYLYKEGVKIEDINPSVETNINLVSSTSSCMGLYDTGVFYSETMGNGTNEYLRFLWGDEEFICMLEVFEVDDSQGYYFNFVEYEVPSGETITLTDPTKMGLIDFGDGDVPIQTAKYYCLGSKPTSPHNMITAEKWGDGITKLKAKSIAQWEAPSNPNPSVYDNIYNFYYENLFANEALDELGAEVGKNSLTMRQWLAHTATIVSISLLAAALVILVIKIFKLIAGSISDIWG